MDAGYLNVTFRPFEVSMGFNEKDANYDVVSKCLDIQFGVQTQSQMGPGFYHNKIIIIKKGAEEHKRTRIYPSKTCKNPTTCNTSIVINVLTKDDEYKTIGLALQTFARPHTCDYHYFMEADQSVRLQCSEQAAQQALEKAAEVSKGLFGANSDQWLDQAKKFIIQAPNAQFILKRLDPALEAQIHHRLGNQQGAINLLEDLKKKTYSVFVEIILHRLLDGVYGDYSTKSICSTFQLNKDLAKYGFDDLANLALEDHYQHDGPNAQAHLQELIGNVLSDMGKEKKGKL